MPSLDAPDWERVAVTVKAAGAVPDAPDWERVVVGSGGVPISPPGGISPISIYYNLGYLGLTVDPTITNASQAHGNGPVTLNAFTAFATASANFVTMQVNNTNTVTPNENFVGIYDSGQTTAGTATLLASSPVGACDPFWNSGGLHKIGLGSSALLVAGGLYYGAFLNNGAQPTFQYCSFVNPNPTIINPLGTTLPLRFNTATNFTSLPATISFSGVSLQGGPYMMFIS